jgi:hypothetical protein
MASHLERKLAKTARVVGDLVVFDAIQRGEPPSGAALRLVFSRDDAGLAAAAGLLGPLSQHLGVRADPLSEWQALRAFLRRTLIGALVGMSERPIEADTGLLGQTLALMHEQDSSETATPTGLANTLNELIGRDQVRLVSISPLVVQAIAPAGTAPAQLVNELGAARHLRRCPVCERAFLSPHARQATYCGGACRKSAVLARGAQS